MICQTTHTCILYNMICQTKHTCIQFITDHVYKLPDSTHLYPIQYDLPDNTYLYPVHASVCLQVARQHLVPVSCTYMSCQTSHTCTLFMPRNSLCRPSRQCRWLRSLSRFSSRCNSCRFHWLAKLYSCTFLILFLSRTNSRRSCKPSSPSILPISLP